MSEQNQQEPNTSERQSIRARRIRTPDTRQALDGMDHAQQHAHLADRAVPARRETFPKDDRRSSTLLTERERSERWPLG
jgi:hypothetical protein